MLVDVTMGTFWHLAFLLPLVSVVLGSAPKGPWDKFNYAPKSRTVWAQSIRQVEGTVKNAHNLATKTGVATLSGNQSYVTLDFGFEVSLVFRIYADSIISNQE